ncbi:MAG: hypothetical protein LHV69_09860 [Elusimicrobia bacterium]|nr:hypothetical protein [Candidatus Obscuribacterium magneticum]
MKLILLSESSFWDPASARPYKDINKDINEALKTISNDGHEVLFVSNRPKPTYLNGNFPYIGFKRFLLGRARKNALNSILIKRSQLKQGDMVVIGASDNDFRMAVNNKCLLIRADWSSAKGNAINQYGVPLHNPQLIPRVVGLLADEQPWNFKFESEFINVYALANAGTYGESDLITKKLLDDLRSCLKYKSKSNRNGFLLHLLSSLLATKDFYDVDYWSYYPSSEPFDEGEEMKYFTDQARTMFGKRTWGPLIIRHKRARVRHQENSNRTDPKDQLDTIHLNREYKNKLNNKKIVIMDDYLNYGLSFGVAASLLRYAGVKKVICVAMGQFSHNVQGFDIEILSKDPFKPISKYQYKGCSPLMGQYNNLAKLAFVEKFRNIYEQRYK